METALFVLSVTAYAVVYFVVKWVARLVLKQEKEAVKPRVLALGAMVVAAVALCVWARLSLVDEATLASLSDFEAGRYVGNVVGGFAFPAIVATLVVAFRILRARKRLVEHKKLDRPSPQW